MKTAIYIEDGVVQLVITPETEFEKNAMTTLMDTDIDAQIFSGSFYDCRGGWVRQKSHYPNDSITWMNDKNMDDKSLILKVKDSEKSTT